MRTSTSFCPLLLLLLLLGPSPALAFGKKPVNPDPAPSPPPAPAPTPPPAPAPAPAPNTGNIPAPTPGSGFLSCLDPISGTWTFGNAPTGCNVSPAQSTPYALAQYSPVIFHDTVTAQRTASMTALFAVAREMGTYYLKRRNPQVGADELSGFLAGFYTLLNQESFWTHYRLGTDGKLRYMRGDALHGFGIMQVDDRSHAVALNQGKGVDLAENMIYGLDIYYAAWVRSASASCVSSASDFKARARSAWSAYNGGPSQLCRWANPAAASAAKDVAYEAKYSAQAWLSLVTNRAAPSALDVVCLAEGARPCANR